MAMYAVVVTRSVPARDVLERLLRRAGCSALHATCADAACTIARSRQCIMLCTPEQDWRGMIAAMNEADSIPLPVTVVTASPDKEFATAAVRSGAFDVISLSDPPDVVLECIARALALCERTLLVRRALR